MKRLLALALVFAPATASADDNEIRPDRRARRMASEANLEPVRLREGLAFGIMIGAGMQVAFSETLDEASGTGGAIDLRVGTSATDSLAWFVDFVQAGTPRQGDTGDNKLNQTSVLGAGAQWYFMGTLWLRGGAGLGHLQLRSEEGSTEKQKRYGLGGYGGGGVDLLRRGRFALSGEVLFVSGIYRDGFVSAVCFQLGATWW